MEYNKAKKVLEKIAGILGIISSALYLLLALIMIVFAFRYFSGDFNYTYYDYYFYEQ